MARRESEIACNLALQFAKLRELAPRLEEAAAGLRMTN